MTQVNHSSFQSDQTPFERSPTCSRNESPCSSSATLFPDEDHPSQAQAHKLADVNQDVHSPLVFSSIQDTVADIYSSNILPTKCEFNPNAVPFVPSHSTICRLESSSPDTLVDMKYSWLNFLPIGSSTIEPSHRHHLAQALALSDRWSYTALHELAHHFCWIGSDHAHTASCPGSAALFAQDVRDALLSAHTTWESTCFTFHLRKYVLENLESYWSSLDNPTAMSSCNNSDATQCKSAFNLSCFTADIFAVHLIDAPTMHECLGILLSKMAGVEHVFAIQAMVMRAGARLWQGANSHRSLREFTIGFLQRTTSLPDDASLTGIKTSIHQVTTADNILGMIKEWHAQRSEYPSPVFKSIWA